MTSRGSILFFATASLVPVRRAPSLAPGRRPQSRSRADPVGTLPLIRHPIYASMLCVLLRTGFPIASWTLLIAGILVFTRVRGLAGELKTGCSRRGSETVRGLPRRVRVHFAGQVIETGQRRLGAKNKAESDQKRLDARRFWRSLPPSSTFKLSLAVFFTIAAIGFATDLFNPVGAPFYTFLYGQRTTGWERSLSCGLASGTRDG